MTQPATKHFVARAASWAGWAGAALALALVALAYLNPHLMLDLSDRFWSCF
jgi:hypothetical protein